MGDNIEQLERSAIRNAISQNWEEAVTYNQKILESQPKNISALNRLGMAYIKTNHPTLAKNAFLQVTKLDPHDAIAKKNLSLAKNSTLPSSGKKSFPTPCITSFIEEPGKSKVIPLVKIAEPKIINSLCVGQSVDFKAGRHKLSIIDSNKHYLGCLPDNISSHLLKLLRSGYHYNICIKSTNPKNFSVFIQEIKRSKKLRGTPSFSINGELFPKTCAGEPNLPPLEIFDPLLGEEVY